jgi:hypothetical protein
MAAVLGQGNRRARSTKRRKVFFSAKNTIDFLIIFHGRDGKKKSCAKKKSFTASKALGNFDCVMSRVRSLILSVIQHGFVREQRM